MRPLELLNKKFPGVFAAYVKSKGGEIKGKMKEFATLTDALKSGAKEGDTVRIGGVEGILQK